MTDKKSGAEVLVEAFTIFAKYTKDSYITHCEHDVMYVNVLSEKVSEEDKKILAELGFSPTSDGEFFQSFRHGSC